MKPDNLLIELARRYAEGAATAADTKRLQDTLRADATARRWFRAYMEIDAALGELGESNAAKRLMQDQPEPERTSRNRISGHMRVAMGGVAACLLVGASLFWTASLRATAWGTVERADVGVVIVNAAGARAARTGDRLAIGDALDLSSGGTAGVSIDGLGVASLGPETILHCSEEPHCLKLANGSIEIFADKQEVGQPWRVRTPQAEASILGTQFSIASTDGRTALRVSEGAVEFTSLLTHQAETVKEGKRAIAGPGLPLVVTSSRPGSALLITSRKPPHADWDKFNYLVAEKLLSAQLWHMGFRVDVKHYEEIQRSDLVDRAILIASIFDEGVGEEALRRIGLAQADVPVICLEPEGFPELGMTGPEKHVDFDFPGGRSSVEFVAPGHPLSAGLNGSRDGLLRGVIGWGRPARGATRIAHLPDNPQRAVLFAYDAGQAMIDFPAPARRVGLFLDPTGISRHSDDSWRILEAAVNWCVATGSEK